MHSLGGSTRVRDSLCWRRRALQNSLRYHNGDESAIPPLFLHVAVWRTCNHAYADARLGHEER
eukprot:8287800-Alexandrium_andersonii.AAC.1